VSRWLQTEPPVEKPSYIRTGREGGRESGPHGKSIEMRGVGSVEKVRCQGEQVAEHTSSTRCHIPEDGIFLSCFAISKLLKLDHLQE
jgi:hypothetical protein